MAQYRPELQWPGKLAASAAFGLAGIAVGVGLYFGSGIWPQFRESPGCVSDGL
jgi:hypothetical protein